LFVNVFDVAYVSFSYYPRKGGVEMGIFNRLKDGLEQSVNVSQRLLKDAKKNSQTWEDTAILRLDIKRIDNRMNSLIRDLGISVYSILKEEGRQSISVKSAGVKEIFNELAELQSLRDVKEAKLLPGKELDLS